MQIIKVNYRTIHPLFSSLLTGEIKSRMFHFLHSQMNILRDENDQNILLLFKIPPLEALYGCAVIHVSQLDNWAFNLAYYSSSFNLELIDC